jgi:hypothetical protein
MKDEGRRMNSDKSKALHDARAGRRLFPVAGGALVLLFILHPSSIILAKQPAFFERKEHYYKAKGVGITVKWEVPQMTVEEGRDLTATLVVSSTKPGGLTNPTEVVRPDLAKLPEFAKRFSVTDAPDSPRNPSDKEVRFTYKLRPRNRTVDRVPALEFYFYSSAAAPGKDPFRQARADSVTITVTAPPPKPPVPMTEADRLFHVTTGPDVLREPFVPGAWAWVAVAGFGPVAALGWFLVWRGLYPDAARLAKLHRSRAARRATDAVRKAGRALDPPAAIATAVLGYLRTRFPLPEAAVTPSEIAAALVEAKVPYETAEQTADVFRACDRARFAPVGDNEPTLGAEAEAAIVQLEALA